MIRTTCDVNVLVSGFPASRGTTAELVEHWLRREFTLVLSEHILTEAAKVWERPYWAARYSRAQVQAALELLNERATLVAPVATVHGIGEDEEDDLVLATAIAGSVDFLVTGE